MQNWRQGLFIVLISGLLGGLFCVQLFKYSERKEARNILHEIEVHCSMDVYYLVYEEENTNTRICLFFFYPDHSDSFQRELSPSLLVEVQKCLEKGGWSHEVNERRMGKLGQFTSPEALQKQI